MIASLVAVTSFAVGLLAARPSEPRTSEPCPPGTSLDEVRTERAAALLATPSAGRALLAHDELPIVCWGPSEPAVMEDRSHVRLDPRASDREAAARLGHLLLHLRDGVPLAEGCGALAMAESREREAHALEDHLRAELGLVPLEAAALERVVSGYRDRCAAR